MQNKSFLKPNFLVAHRCGVDERCVGDPPFFADAQHSGMRIVRLDEDGPKVVGCFFAEDVV